MSKLEPTLTNSDLMATERLRCLLDERGVEWTSGSTEVSRNICTDFCPDAGVSMSAWENDGKLGIDAHTLYRFTPEQAIAITLGTGTCIADETETISVRGDTCGYYFDKHFTIHVMECSECGHTYEHVWGNYEYCPHCGRRVVEVDA